MSKKDLDTSKVDIEHVIDEDNGGDSWQTKLDFLPMPESLKTGFMQNIFVGCIFFCCPGFFNALQGLGAAGGADPAIGAAMNVALNGFFTVFGCVGGLLFNLLGNKILLVFGGSCYSAYSISVYLWGQNEAFAPLAVFASSLLGIGAGVFWTAQGAMTMSYATEDKKGLFTSIFWVIFNLGGVIGGFLTFASNLSNTGAAGVNATTYFIFCGVMLVGAISSIFLIVHPSAVTRADGKKIIFDKAESPMAEIKNVFSLFTNKYMLLLTPLIIQSNWFYTYEFNGVNMVLFDAATRGLNSGLYWGMQMIGAWIAGNYLLDNVKLGGRRKRAQIGLIIISVINVGQWIYAVSFQLSSPYDRVGPEVKINYSDSDFWVPFILYMYMGLVDSMVQTYAYWIMGAISSSPAVLSRYAGYYKGVQSFGALLSWLIEFMETSYVTQMWICVGFALAFPPPVYVVACMVTDTEEEAEEDGQGSSTVEMYEK